MLIKGHILRFYVDLDSILADDCNLETFRFSIETIYHVFKVQTGDILHRSFSYLSGPCTVPLNLVVQNSYMLLKHL